MDSAPPQPPQEHSAMLLRVMDCRSACVLLRASQSVVHIELDPPLSPRSHAKSHTVNALSPVPATVWLGAYNTTQHRFTGCSLVADLPEQTYSRVAYSRKRC
jgi:hypothetical protein